MTGESKRRGPIPVSVWLLLLLWIAATVAAVIWGLPHIEEDLAGRGEAALVDQPVGAQFVGRDARLSGQVADSAEVDRAVATVRELRGVRRVTTGAIDIDPDAAPSEPAVELDPPQLILFFDGKAMRISGTVPDRATADAIRAAAVARWGPDVFVDRIEVGVNTSGAAWLAGIVSAVGGLDDLIEGNISVGPAGVLVAGSVATTDLVTDVQSSLEAAFGPEIPVENRLQVAELSSPSFIAELLADGSVSLGGVMPDQATIDGIVAAASGVYGSGSVVNEMVVGTSIDTPAFVRLLPAVFGAIEGLNPWRFAVDSGRADLTGLAVSESAVAGTAERLGLVFDPVGLAIDNQSAVDGSAVASVLTDLLKGTATFEVASARLSQDAMGLLDKAIEILADNTATVLTVEGHTDDVGTENDNLALSKARAKAVVDYLIAGGIDAARLTAVGYGESRPVTGNDTADGRSQNRRIQFVVEEGESS